MEIGIFLVSGINLTFLKRLVFCHLHKALKKIIKKIRATYLNTYHGEALCIYCQSSTFVGGHL